jgi:hypothetical protein
MIGYIPTSEEENGWKMKDVPVKFIKEGSSDPPLYRALENIFSFSLSSI